MEGFIKDVFVRERHNTTESQDLEGKSCPLQWVLLVLLLELFIFEFLVRKALAGNSLAVQWLGLHAFTPEGLSSIPSGGTKIPQAVWPKKEKKSSS